MTSLGVDFDHILEPAEGFANVNNTKDTQKDKVDGLLEHNID